MAVAVSLISKAEDLESILVKGEIAEFGPDIMEFVVVVLPRDLVALSSIWSWNIGVEWLLDQVEVQGSRVVDGRRHGHHGDRKTARGSGEAGLSVLLFD